MASNSQKVFPFSQYYVQNIESAITFESGANEYAYISVTASSITQSATIPFIGGDGLFAMADDCTITKTYDSTKDQEIFDINGDIAVNSISMKVVVKVDSSDYIYQLIIISNWIFRSGTVTVNKDIALQPGVSVSIAKNATMKLLQEHLLYVLWSGWMEIFIRIWIK